jgi:hypothetical protein
VASCAFNWEILRKEVGPLLLDNAVDITRLLVVLLSKQFEL